jgi:hypothetical protein
MQPMQAQLEHVVHGARQLVETALGPWGGAAACIDAYEAAIRSAADAQVIAAQAVHLPPARSIVALYAGLMRDVGAVQVSTARWILDV